MNLYLAGGYGYLRRDWCKTTIKSDPISYLGSFFYADETLEELIPHFKNFLLDSGAFTFMVSQKSHCDFDGYLERYADFINKNKVEKFFELDIDAVVGYEKVLEYRERLERMTRKQCIPVWHKTRGHAEYIRHCEEYPYVAIGGVVINEIKKTEYKVFPKMIEQAHKRNAKVHGLGFTNLAGLEKYHFDSVDSTAWVSGNRFGHIYKFNGRTMEKVSAPDGYRLADKGRGVAENNMKEWIKFQKYAEVKL